MKKSLIGYILRTRGNNGGIRVYEDELGGKFWEFPWIWKQRVLRKKEYKKVRITIKELK